MVQHQSSLSIDDRDIEEDEQHIGRWGNPRLDNLGPFQAENTISSQMLLEIKTRNTQSQMMEHAKSQQSRGTSNNHFNNSYSNIDNEGVNN